MIRFLTPAAAMALDGLPDDRPWAYLGKDTRLLQALGGRLGRSPLPLAGVFHEECKRLRRPFLDQVASWGRTQGGDSLSWWAGTLAWKDAAASDLFLLAAYEAVALRLEREARPLGAVDLLVIIEDPWLFAQLREALKARADAVFQGESALLACKTRALLLGAAQRLRWALRMARSRLRYALRPAPVPPARDAAALYSHVLPQTLEGETSWRDAYLTGLAEELESAGWNVRRVTDPDVTGYEAELSLRHASVAPLLRFGSWRGVAKAALALPPPPPRPAEIAGLPVGLLLEREWWHDLSRAGRSAYLFLNEAATRLFGSGPYRLLVLPWENMPQERMLLAAARGAGLRTVGYQHSTLPLFHLHFFAGAGESETALLPDVLVASGPHSLLRLSQEGYPADRLVLGGSRRFPLEATPAPAASGSKDVLVVLPIDLTQSLHLLAALARAYPRGGQGFRFRVRPHPAEPRSASKLPFPAELETAPLREALGRCGTVVFSGSTAGLEALACGHPVLRYRPGTYLDIDPCDMLENEDMPTATDGDLRERLESLRQKPWTPSPKALEALPRLFSPLDRDAWQRALR